MIKSKNNKHGQITLFIIIAIIIAVIIVLFFVFRGKIFEESIPAEFKPVYSYYLSCIEHESLDGAKLLGEKGGRIKDVDFSPGSSYMPFSSHLGFMGIGIPYWYYISGNGIRREQVPSKEKMQSELNDFVKEGLMNCDFSQFEERGFQINFSEPEYVASEIKDNLINLKVNQDISISFGKNHWTGKLHSLAVNSNLGKFYELALKIYKKQDEEMFLENYGVDIIRLYAPVDGSDISCTPRLWLVNDIRNNLTNALEGNTGAIKIKGDYYKLKDKDNKYFVKDIGEKTDFNINFMYSKYWPTKMEVWPSEEGIMRADPIGLEQGLGLIGFCYVPYHFVYDLGYPVLVQLYSKDEMFQFPVVVYIDKTKPRKALPAEGLPDVIPELCEHKLTSFTVYSYNVNFEPVPAKISFKCFDTSCDIGETKIENSQAVLTDNFPQCGNGYIIASAEGYETKKEIVSTITEGNVDIFLDRKYKINLAVHERGSEIEGYAVVSFIKNNKTNTFAYPEQKEIELTEGQYQIKVYSYSNTSIHLQGSSTPKCVDIPKTGIVGFFGATEKKCFNLDIPSQTVEFAVSGGGTENYYIAESQLQESKNIIINIEKFGAPKSLEELQKNYNAVDVSHLDIAFD